MFETGETHCPTLKTKNPENFLRVFIERLAATYSRRTYRTTTIGKTVFDGRVRNGIGSDHSFMATKKRKSEARSQKPEFSFRTPL
jgi:hypothetical protein